MPRSTAPAGGPEVSVRVHRDGRYLSATPEFFSITGYGPADLAAMRIGDLSVDGERAAARDVWARYVGGVIDLPVGRLHLLRCADGSFRVARTTFLGPTEDPDVFETHWRLATTVEVATRERRVLQAVLTGWRDAERQLAALDPGDPARPGLERHAEELRALYQEESALDRARTTSC